MSPQTIAPSGPAATHLAQRGQPGQLVVVVLGVRHAPVRHVDRVHADPAAGGGDGPRLGMREAGRVREPGHDVVQAHPGQDRHAVPLRLAVHRDRVAARRELLAEQLGEGGVGELRLLQAHDVGPPLVQPRQQPRHPLLDRVHVPGRHPHGPTLSGGHDHSRTPDASGPPRRAPAGRVPGRGHRAVERDLAEQARRGDLITGVVDAVAANDGARSAMCLQPGQAVGLRHAGTPGYSAWINDSPSGATLGSGSGVPVQPAGPVEAGHDAGVARPRRARPDRAGRSGRSRRAAIGARAGWSAAIP